jgi:hypothetical protein
MTWPQILTVVGANLAALLTFMGMSIALIIHMNRRIDAMYETPKKRKKKR